VSAVPQVKALLSAQAYRAIDREIAKYPLTRNNQQ